MSAQLLSGVLAALNPATARVIQNATVYRGTVGRHHPFDTPEEAAQYNAGYLAYQGGDYPTSKAGSLGWHHAEQDYDDRAEDRAEMAREQHDAWADAYEARL